MTYTSKISYASFVMNDDMGPPKNISSMLLKAQTLKEGGKLQEARAVYQTILKADPHQPEALYFTGVLAMDLGRFDIGEQMLRRALDTRPDYAEGRRSLAELLHGQNRFEEAEAEYRQLLKLRPTDATIFINLGNVLRSMERYEEAVAPLKRAVMLAPELAEAWDILGATLLVVGHVEEARRTMEKAVALRPREAKFHRNLSMLKTYREDDLPLLKDILAQPNLSDRRDIHYTLAKALDDLKRYDEAFFHHAEGNRLRRAMHPYDGKQTRQQFTDLKRRYEKPSSKTKAASDDDTPIFVLGMPRSGTTLVAQILASHSKVHSAGETPYMSETATAEDYLNRLRKYAPAGIPHIVDKMPDNFLHIGHIARILPQARIIHCTRDPLDTCVSIFRTHAMVPRAYGCDLKELGEYYGMYRDLMAFWHKMLPGRIYDISYEKLLNDFEGEARRLLEHCGLKWEKQCLEFYKTKGNVRTASSAQVRSAPYHSSIGAWKHYEKHLAPLKKALGITA